MKLTEAEKFLKLRYRIRRKSWKKHIYCTEIFDYDGHRYMKLWGFPKNQRITEVETLATDWEKL